MKYYGTHAVGQQLFYLTEIFVNTVKSIVGLILLESNNIVRTQFTIELGRDILGIIGICNIYLR